jgi:hypothetical protein
MKTEKPTPNGASFSEKSIETRLPKANPQSYTDQARTENKSFKIEPRALSLCVIRIGFFFTFNSEARRDA